MIKLAETENEYLLYIPEEKEYRIDSINGRRRDTKLNCWAFPKSDEVYEILITEFGDTGNEVLISDPKSKMHYSTSSNIEAGYSMIPEEERLKQKIKSELEKKKFEEKVKDYAKKISHNNNFKEIIDKTPFDKHFPIQIALEMDDRLKKMLNINYYITLDDLINSPETNKKLRQEVKELGNIIRKQRNFFAHRRFELEYHFSRILLVLSSASILWNFFYERSS